jgi:ABC-type bacteriocin/lantibiotic exporter with double-glycine peptidase domain
MIGLLEAIGIATFIPLLSLINTPKNEANENLIYLVEAFEYFNINFSIISVLILILIIFIFKGIVTFIAFYSISLQRGYLLKKLKGELYFYYMNCKKSFFLSQNPGEFSSIVNEQVTRSLHAFNHYARGVIQVIISTIYLIFLTLIMPEFFVYTLLIAPVLYILFSRINSVVKRLSLRVTKENGQLYKYLIEGLLSYKYIAATGNGNFINNKVVTAIDKLTNSQIETGKAAALTQAIRDPLAAIFIATIIFVQGVINNVQLETIVVTLAIFYRILSSMMSFQNSWQSVMENIGGLLKVDCSLDQLKNTQRIYNNIVDKSVSPLITLDAVDFKYPSKNIKILSEINLTINKFDKIGIIGKSGEGKSTLIDIILGLERPTKGTLKFKQINKNSTPPQRSNLTIGYVNPDNIIFNDTIQNNITMTNSILSKKQEKQLHKVCHLVHIFDYIMRCPEGFTTLLSDKGGTLSSGQKQRILLAREIYRNPNILILDEATNSMDTTIERLIVQNLLGINNLTLIVITHRVSMLENFDKIVVLQNGKIADIGSFEELELKRSSLFYKLLKENRTKHDNEY